MGASFSNSSTSKLPSVVSNTIDTFYLSGQLAFGDALVAGEIAVRGYVSEATRHKRGAQRLALRCAMFQEQPATLLEMSRSAINKSGQRQIAVAAGGQCRARFVA